MEWPCKYRKARKSRTTCHSTSQPTAPFTEIPTDNGQRANAQKGVVTTREEWEVVAGAWPLKRLVEIWNVLSGVTPVEKFTNRQIALERIWRAVESPEQA